MYRGRDWPYAYLIKHELKMAWAAAKEGSTPAQRRADAIKAEIEALNYKPARYDIMPAKRRFEADPTLARRLHGRPRGGHSFARDRDKLASFGHRV
ncbi:MAG: hypothetical protein WA975_17240 [Mesorhizobium sp.]